MDKLPVTIDLAPLAGIVGAFDQLRAQGWTTTDGVSSVAASLNPATDPGAALRQLDGLAPAALSIEAIGEIAGTRKVTVTLTEGALAVSQCSLGDPRDLFGDRSAQDDAVEADEGDVAAALRLPLEWHVQATFSPALLVDYPDNVNLTVSLTAAAVTAYVLGVDATNVDLLTAGNRRTVLVALDVQDHALFGSVALAGLPSGAADRNVTLRAAALLDGEKATTSLPPAAFLPHQDHVIPAAWSDAAAHLRVLAAQQLWRAMATSEKSDGERLTLTFHGYKKSSFDLPLAVSWQRSHVEEAMSLRDWALYDESPDRLLAVRQVVSLYDTESAPFMCAEDVQASAEVIYTGLRTAAVAEAVKSSREAHAQAQDAVRQTVKNATDMVKGATERMLASLVAVGAVLMANASRVLPDDTGRLLVLLIAAFLALLAVSSALLEGPLLALPADKLKEDLNYQKGLLTDVQRNKIDGLPSLVAARSRTNVVRWAVPVILLVFAGLLFCFGHPGKYN